VNTKRRENGSSPVVDYFAEKEGESWEKGRRKARRERETGRERECKIKERENTLYYFVIYIFSDVLKICN
jgi:hypothetical protein